MDIPANNATLDVSFNPPGESASTLNIERATIAGEYVTCVFYGMEVLLYILTAHLMLTSPRTRSTQVRGSATPGSLRSYLTRPLYFLNKWRYFIYITVQFILCSLGVGGGSRNIILAFVDNRAYPGGPEPWSNMYYNTPASIVCNSSFVVSAWLQDGFLLYRFLIIWQYNWLAFVIPCLIYLTSIAFSILLLIQISTSGLDINASTNEHIGIIFWSLSITLNVLLTALIVGRLIYIGRAIRRALAPTEKVGQKTRLTWRSVSEKTNAQDHNQDQGGFPDSSFSATYTSVGAMLVESAALYTSFVLTFLILYILTEAGSDILLGVIGVLASFTPLLIAYRVIQGKAWTSETSLLTSRIIFNERPNISQAFSNANAEASAVATVGTLGSLAASDATDANEGQEERSSMPTSAAV